MASIFSRIVAGEIPSYKIAEDDRYYAFLDINPLAKGHTLVIPKQEVDYFYDLDDDTLQGMLSFNNVLNLLFSLTTLLKICLFICLNSLCKFNPS